MAILTGFPPSNTISPTTRISEADLKQIQDKYKWAPTYEWECKPAFREARWNTRFITGGEAKRLTAQMWLERNRITDDK